MVSMTPDLLPVLERLIKAVKKQKLCACSVEFDYPLDATLHKPGCSFRSAEILVAKIRADERLRKAAPDMLAALEGLLIMMDRGPKPRKLDEALTWQENDNLARGRAEVAIARATGKETA